MYQSTGIHFHTTYTDASIHCAARIIIATTQLIGIGGTTIHWCNVRINRFLHANLHIYLCCYEYSLHDLKWFLLILKCVSIQMHWHRISEAKMFVQNIIIGAAKALNEPQACDNRLYSVRAPHITIASATRNVLFVRCNDKDNNNNTSQTQLLSSTHTQGLLIYVFCW